MAEQKMILLIEDEPLLGTLLKQRLEKENFKVVLARDGEEGLKLCKEINPSLILLDIILPKVSGFEILETVKKDSAYPQTPVIIISNLGQNTDVEKGRSLGAIGYFVKANLSVEELVEKVKVFFTQGK
jgi:DNA-binding response OmpR family regulator